MMGKRSAALLLAAVVWLTAWMPYAWAQESGDCLTIARQIVTWKKAQLGLSADEPLLCDTFLQQAGTTAGDWYPFAMGRLGMADDASAYLAVIRSVVQQRYTTPEKLSAAKATEWHRIILAVLALGGDPTQMGTEQAPIDLVADGTYDRGKTVSLGRQGINGWIWGLIALDSMAYEVPQDAFYTREDIIEQIIAAVLDDGGFSLSGGSADPDITAMAIQALAPYYNSKTTYLHPGTGEETTVRDVVDQAVECLSRLQLKSAGYASWGTENVESSCQVLVALCALGIDPLTDQRFICQGRTLLDAICDYQMTDGGFAHSFTEDPANPDAVPGQSNSMASEQVLYAMAALWRQQQGMRRLYDLRPEMSASLSSHIRMLNRNIAALDGDTAAGELEDLLTDYYCLPESERSYVAGFWTLRDLAVDAGLSPQSIAAATTVRQDWGAAAAGKNPEFTLEQRREVDTLPEELTTEYEVTVERLLQQLEASQDFADQELYREKLLQARETIAAIRNEVDRLNQAILETIYPMEELTLRDLTAVEGLARDIQALSAYDQTQIRGREDVETAQLLLHNRLRGVLIGVGIACLAAGVGTWTVVRIRRRRRQKAAELEALAAQFPEDEA